MKIILLRESGNSRSLRLPRKVVYALAGLAALAAVLCSLVAYQTMGHGAVDDSVISRWRARLAEQQAEVQRLRSRSQAETQAVGRQLAQMQARLLRMEALGARVAEVADLDEGEFSFAEPAPQGGPLARSEDPLEWPDLRSDLDQLAQDLRGRESELEVLESFLRNQEYQDARSVAGRPIKWGWMSSPYGSRVDPFSGKKAWHAGVDFAGKGDSDVIAVASGVVTFAGNDKGYGAMVEINHGDGYVTRYGHHSKVLVSPGDIVKRGQVIGKMGSSGRSTGPHVHFEVLKDGRHVDPARYVARRG